MGGRGSSSGAKGGVIPQIKNPAGIPSNHMTEDEFLGLRGVGYAISDATLDKVGGANMTRMTEKQRNKTRQEMTAESDSYFARRAAAREEYKALVERGVIIPKTTIEKTITAAHGNPKLSSTQAARRMAQKRGIDWKTGKKL